MWQQEFKLVFTAYGAQFEDWGVCATFYRISSSRLAIRSVVQILIGLNVVKENLQVTLSQRLTLLVI